jgi:MFS family permease
LQERNQVELLIEKMQPSWLDKGRSRWWYRVIVGLIGGLTLGLIVGLTTRLIGGLIAGLYGLIGGLIWVPMGLIFGLTGGLVLGLTGGLVLGLTGGLIFGLNNIEPVENFRISMLPKVRREILRSLKRWLIFGLIFGLTLWVTSGRTSGVTIINGLTIGLTIGLTLGVISGLKQDLKTRSRSNQGIWNSLYSFIWVTLFSYPLTVILLAGIQGLGLVGSQSVTDGHSLLSLLFIAGVVQESMLRAILFAITGALLFGFLAGGGFACIQHLCLRIILTQDRKIPWNYARFLNYCVERRLLQRIGGRYRFIHRELLDHFAQQPR